MFVVIDEAANYEVNEFGDIQNRSTQKLLKHTKDKLGYHKVRLYYEPYKFKDFYVHRLVAEYHLDYPKEFDPDMYESLVVMHKDSNPDNNQVDNLEWTVRSILAVNKHKDGAYKSYGKSKRAVILDGVMEFPSIKDAAIYLWKSGLETHTLNQIKTNLSMSLRSINKRAYGHWIDYVESK